MRELMGCLELENQVIEGMMSQLHLVCNYNNMLIKNSSLLFYFSVCNLILFEASKSSESIK